MITYALKGMMREDIKDYRDYRKKIIFKRYWQHFFEEIDKDLN
jgi:hypothetical protein